RERHGVGAARVVLARERGVHLGAPARIGAAGIGHGTRLGRAGGAASRGCGQGQDGDELAHQDLASRWMWTGLRFMRFTTWPASWPQAASMSSPRVLRTVAMMPASS